MNSCGSQDHVAWAQMGARGMMLRVDALIILEYLC